MAFDGPNLVLTYYELKKGAGGVFNLESGQTQKFSAAGPQVVEIA